MRTTAALLSLLVASSAVAGGTRGILITNVTFTSEGVHVAWATDMKPPYRAAVHVPRAALFRRDSPVEYVDTDSTSAVIPVDDCTPAVFVQVYKPDDPAVCSEDMRRMLKADWYRYLEREDRRKTVSVADVRVPPQYDARGFVLCDGLPGPVSLDATTGPAAAWIPCPATDVTVRVVSTVASRGPRPVTVTNEVVVARDPYSRFPGVRVERSMTTNGIELAACEAYSFRTNVSQAVLVRTGYVSPYGSETAWRDSTNWYADGILVTATNAPCASYSYDRLLPWPDPEPIPDPEPVSGVSEVRDADTGAAE